MTGAGVDAPLYISTDVALLLFGPGSTPMMVHLSTAICAIEEAGKKTHLTVKFAGSMPVLPYLLHPVKGVLVDDGLVGVLNHHLLVLRDVDALFGLVRLGGAFEVDRVPQVLLPGQNFGDGVRSPFAKRLRVVVLLALGPLGLDGARRGDVALLGQEAGDLRGTVALQAQVKNQLDCRGRLRVRHQLAILAFQVAVGDLGRHPLPGHPFHPLDRPLLFGTVAGIPLVEQVAEGGELVVALLAVHPVTDSDKVNVMLLEKDLGEHPHLQVVAAQAGHILDDDPLDLSGLDVGNHALEIGPLEVGPAVPVVHIDADVDVAVGLAVDQKHFFLRLDLSRGVSANELFIKIFLIH